LLVARFKKYSALLLLMAVFFVANNLAHDSAHTFGQNVGVQVECDSCHVFKGTLVAAASESSTLSFFMDLFFEEPTLGSLPSRFSLYLSRAPPKV
jgi:cytochrome c